MAVIMRSAALLTGTSFLEPGLTSLWWAPGTVGGSVADATDILARFRAIWEAAKASISTGVTIDYDPICLAVEATTGVLVGAFAGTDPSSTVCTATGDGLPRQTQGLLRWSTSSVVDGRRLRGRMFIPCPPESLNDASGVPSSSYVTNITAAGGTIFTAGATASSAVIWHRPKPGSAGTSALITGASCATTWSVLRSRRS